jgi:uncharacterized protein YjbI with pentapeptide repeats
MAGASQRWGSFSFCWCRYGSGMQEKKDGRGTITYPNATLLNPILGGLGALFLIYAAIRQAQTATEVARTGNRQAEIAGRRHVTDTFSKAVEQLASDKMEVRIGGIYTLERLAGEALDSPRDADRDLYWTVMETLTTFVRERARWNEPEPSAPDMAAQSDLWQSGSQSNQARQQPRTPATDIAAVLQVLRRRPDAGREREQLRDWHSDLRMTDLRDAPLYEAHLEGAVLFETHLEGAILRGAHLAGAYLYEAHLDGAGLLGAHLAGAMLYEAHLDGADLIGADLRGADLVGAYLEGANLSGADLRGANLSGAHLEGANLEGTIGDAKTRLPDGVARPAGWAPYVPPPYAP